ncbi:hypothetical protein IWZ03DRAFT_36669 [Phyllosticta citriasiana]|uniref:Uncharacterized protein n=1 Tax=Phyllosticta citriasiana TaxID=595635 RepID=A0ABR1L1M8_9PEZI
MTTLVWSILRHPTCATRKHPQPVAKGKTKKYMSVCQSSASTDPPAMTTPVLKQRPPDKPGYLACHFQTDHRLPNKKPKPPPSAPPSAPPPPPQPCKQTNGPKPKTRTAMRKSNPGPEQGRLAKPGPKAPPANLLSASPDLLPLLAATFLEPLNIILHRHSAFNCVSASGASLL